MSPHGDLRARLLAEIDAALHLLRDAQEAGDVRDLLLGHRARVERPLQVAVMGRVSSGKSTLVNALVGERLAPTGLLELTFTVTHLRHGSGRAVTVHHEGDGPAVVTMPDLDALRQHAVIRASTALDAGNRADLARIDRVEVMIDNPHLALFDIIDTPGIDSVYGEEAAKAYAAAGVAPGDAAAVRRDSLRAAGGADALLVVLDNLLASAVDERLLADFRGPGMSGRTPVTTLGVLTKVENYWNPFTTPDPWAEADRNVERLLATGTLQDLLFEFIPVCSLVGEAAADLDETDLADLTALARVPRARLDTLLTAGEVFANSAELPLTTQRRIALFTSFTRYGVHLACELVDAGADTVESLSAALLDASGVPVLRKRLTDHFGHRADLIKLQRLRDDIAPLPHSRVPSLRTPADKWAVLHAVGGLEQFARNAQGIPELALLQRLFTRAVAVDEDDRRAMLQLLGEQGRSVAERLGRPATASPDLDEWERLADAAYERWRDRPPVEERAVKQVMKDAAQELRTVVHDVRARLERPW